MLWKKKENSTAPVLSNMSPPNGLFTTHITLPASEKRGVAVQKALHASMQQPQPVVSGLGMDSRGYKESLSYNAGAFTNMPDSLMAWYGVQGFIGYQMCAIISQHWLVDKACTMPARDAIRNGFDISRNDGGELSPEELDQIRDFDDKYQLQENMLQFVRMGRIFGIRICLYEVESDDPEYYEKPFNIDGVKPGSYRGMSQIDPYWVAPELDDNAASNPASRYFYEPTWWLVNGQRIHRTHLAIFRSNEVPDILKPTYFYGGVPLPQRIYERVYAAERTANEAPQLAMTKRLITLKVDLSQMGSNPDEFTKKLVDWTQFMNNYGVKVVGIDESVEQHDTSLADLDAVIMTEYQLVAAVAEVPATKLLGTTPKGFNSTGEFEEASYHEALESIQEHDLTPLVQRHHELLIKSELAPNNPYSTTITWKPLDTPTAKELAEINEIKSRTGNMLINSGAIDGQEERERIIADPESGYDGLTGLAPEPEEEIFESANAEETFNQ